MDTFLHLSQFAFASCYLCLWRMTMAEFLVRFVGQISGYKRASSFPFLLSFLPMSRILSGSSLYKLLHPSKWLFKVQKRRMSRRPVLRVYMIQEYSSFVDRSTPTASNFAIGLFYTCYLSWHFFWGAALVH